MAEISGWYKVELMGHRTLAGLVEEVEIAGTTMLRIDVYRKPPVFTAQDDPPAPAYTQYYSPSALYCLTPTDMNVCVGLTLRDRQRPVARYELEDVFRKEPEEPLQLPYPDSTTAGD